MDKEGKRNKMGEEKVKGCGKKDKKVPETDKKDSLHPHEEEKKRTDELLEDLKRERASFINYKARMEREQEQARLYANQAIVEEFLEVKDSLESALKSCGDGESVTEGVRLTLKRLESILKKHGIKEIESLNMPFDPNIHEAMLFEEGEVESETVSETLQKGYLLNGRVIRPAKVRIIKPIEGGNEDEQNTGN